MFIANILKMFSLIFEDVVYLFEHNYSFNFILLRFLDEVARAVLILR